LSYTSYQSCPFVTCFPSFYLDLHGRKKGKFSVDDILKLDSIHRLFSKSLWSKANMLHEIKPWFPMWNHSCFSLQRTHIGISEFLCSCVAQTCNTSTFYISNIALIYDV
jgi:hypothetical protein